MAYKVEAGGEYIITQPVFDLGVFETFLRRIEDFRLPVFAGIWPLASLRNAEFMRNDLRVSVPDDVMTRMAAATSPEAARAEGVRIAQQMLAAVKPEVQGVQVAAPMGRYTIATEVLSGLLTQQEAKA
jgi:homocysteine S-methyltransferase